MIDSTTRIHDALQQKPELREILPAFHPAFARLNHPVLGRVLPRLVTVADAARIAGVDTEALVEVMNLPALAGALDRLEQAQPRPSEPPPPWLRGAEIVELDVREDLEGGRQPFAAIMKALRALEPGQVLQILAPFEPAPLVRLLGERGWVHHVAWTEGICRLSLFRGHHGLDAKDAEPVQLDEHLVREGASWILDVRELPPPQPLRYALAALDRGALPLIMRHRREPALLLPKLQERGLVWSVRELDGLYEIHIDGERA